MQFVLAAEHAEAKSKKLVIWAPTVVMRHLQRSHPNQIFGSAASDALSHIVTVVLAGESSPLGVGARGWGHSGAHPPSSVMYQQHPLPLVVLGAI